MDARRFDYSTVDRHIASRLKHAANQVRYREGCQVENFIASGAALDHLRFSLSLLSGNCNYLYSDWLEAETFLTPAQAADRLRAAEHAPHPRSASKIPVHAFHQLNAVDLSPSLLPEIIRRTCSGERLSARYIEELIAWTIRNKG